MDKRDIVCKTTGWVLVVMLLVSLLSPIIGTVKAMTLSSSERLGTPLLDKDFSLNSWNKKEMAVFGIYLSNFTVPLIDDYSSAFSSNSKDGSQGRGMKVLTFDDNANSDVNKTMSNMVKVSAELQSGAKAEIYSRSVDFTGNTVTASGWEKANLYQFIHTEGGDGSLTDLNDNNTNGSNMIIKKGAEFAIKVPNVDNSYQTIFSYCNGYDVSSLLSMYATVACDSDYSGKFKDAFEKIDIKNKDQSISTPIFLDAFGNIVYREGERNIIVYPACANQYLTKEKSYNLLNSVFLGGKYILNDANSIVKNTENELYDITGKADKYSNGAVSLYHSSDLLQLAKNEMDSIGGKDGYKEYKKDVFEFYSRYKDNIQMSTNNVGSNIVPFSSPYLTDVLKSDITTDKDTVPFRLNVHGAQNIDTSTGWFQGWVNKGSLEALNNYVNGSPVFMNNNVKRLDEINFFGKETFSLLESPVTTVTSEWRNKDDNKACNVRRKFIYYVGKNMRQGKNEYNGIFNNLQYANNTYDYLNTLMKNGDNNSLLYSDFINSEYSNLCGEHLDITKDKFHSFNKGLDAIENPGNSFLANQNTIVAVYPKSAKLSAVSSYLGFSAETDGELSQMCKSMYFTYLKWYGIISNKYGNELNANIFNENSDLLHVNINDLLVNNALSEDEKKKEVLNRTYLMLDPEKGRDLRKQIYRNSFTDTVFDWYSKMVYGNSQYTSTSDKEGSVGAGQASQGFLGVDNYYNNIFTSWFVNIYDNIALILLGISILLICGIAIIFRKKIMWVLSYVVISVVIIMLTPALGDIVPYVSNKVIQSTFNSKLNYWALCENVSNIEMENNINVKDSNGNDVSSSVVSLIKDLNSNYTDRALLLKYDISRKVTSSGLANMDELQNLKTSSWLLPQIVRQFGSSDGSSDYVYIPMSDALMAARQLYGAYDPRTIRDNRTNTLSSIDETKIKGTLWDGFSTVSDTSAIRIDSGSVTSMGMGLTPLSVDYSNRLHTRFYFLPNFKVSGVGFTKSTDKDFKVPQASIDGAKDNMRGTEEELERSGGLYNNFDSATVKQEYGYLWTTESPLIYMYFNMKDTYVNYTENYGDLSLKTYTIKSTDINGNESNLNVSPADALNSSVTASDKLKNFASMVQGKYINGNVTGDTENRANFMYDALTGKTKDFLDIRHMLKNTVPYLYETQLLAGGDTGKNGVFGEEKISMYPIYRNNYKSWMFRCNWAEKLYSNAEYNEPCKIGLADGSKVKINKPILPQSYTVGSKGEAGREMVFSEAEMKSAGLKESDLSLVELKCLEVNKRTAEDITILLNYVNMDGLTSEALIQQMSLIATMNFCQVMSPDNGFNNQMALYPQSVDLRNISFDAIIRLMVLGATNDNYYTYGNTMYNMIANSDIISVIFLLLASFLCVMVIPFVRSAIMALLLFLALLSVILNFFTGNKMKFKVIWGYAVNLLLFLGINVLFYWSLSMIMNVTSPTDILKLKAISMNIHSPVWVLILLNIICIVFIWLMFKLIKFTLLNYVDMGATAFGMIAENIASKVSDLSTKISDKMNGVDNSAKDDSAGGNGVTAIVDNSVHVSGDNNKVLSDDNSASDSDDTSESSAYSTGYVDDNSGARSGDIDIKIRRGKKK